MARFTHEIVTMDLDTLSAVIISETEAPHNVREGIDTERQTMTLVLPILSSEVR